MLELSLQIFALVLLTGGMWLGYRRWIKLRQTELSRPQMGLIALVNLTLLGGFLGAPFWWVDIPWAFSWDLPPLAGRMLASAGWAFAIIAWMALEKPTQFRLRLVVLMLFTYLTPLVAVILIFHFGVFNWTEPVTYGFFVIAGGMTVITLYYLMAMPDPVQPMPELIPPPVGIQAWLAVVAVVTAIWGIALFITDNGSSPLVWVWPGNLLTSRLIAVMLVTIATGSVYALHLADVAKVMLTGMIVYGVGLCIASLWNGLSGLPIKASYAVAFGIIGVGSALALWMLSRITQSPEHQPV